MSDLSRITICPSFLNSVWKRTFSKLRFECVRVRRINITICPQAAKQSFAEVRSQTEFGNEGTEGKKRRSFRSLQIFVIALAVQSRYGGVVESADWCF